MPKHSVATCPICGGGLCGIRICVLEGCEDGPGQPGIHGLVVCDECDAIWLEPDVSTVHQYPALDNAKCPICNLPLWGEQSHWAEMAEIQRLGWEMGVDTALDVTDDV